MIVALNVIFLCAITLIKAKSICDKCSLDIAAYLTVFRCSKIATNLTVFCCSKFNSNAASKIAINLAAFAVSIRLGVAPIRIETGRYERLSVSERICFHCKSCVEDELHVLINCPLYDELRSNFYQSLQVIGINMDEKSPISQFNFILNSLDEKLIRMSAKFCCEILTRRRKALYK